MVASLGKYFVKKMKRFRDAVVCVLGASPLAHGSIVVVSVRLLSGYRCPMCEKTVVRTECT